MKPKLRDEDRLVSRAIQHLVSLREYIAKDSEQNAALVAKRILDAVDLLHTQPGMGRPGRAPVLANSWCPPHPTSFLQSQCRNAGVDRSLPWPAEVAGEAIRRLDCAPLKFV